MAYQIWCWCILYNIFNKINNGDWNSGLGDWNYFYQLIYYDAIILLGRVSYSTMFVSQFWEKAGIHILIQLFVDNGRSLHLNLTTATFQ